MAFRPSIFSAALSSTLILRGTGDGKELSRKAGLTVLSFDCILIKERVACTVRPMGQRSSPYLGWVW